MQTLARLHGRVLQLPAAPVAASAVQSQLVPTSVPDADLRARLALLEAQVATSQAQLTDLTLQLLREPVPRAEPHLSALQAEYPLGDRPTMPSSGAPSAGSCQPAVPELVCHPTEKRNRLIPLIEYGTRGRYVLISPEQGELTITPDSPEWFAWLASLSSFRFVGQSGRFSARRGYNRRPNRCWYAQRTIHQQFHSKYIGVSECITVALLEQVAAYLQSYALMS